MGGIVAQTFAIHHPERCLSMTSMSVSAVGQIRPPKKIMDALFENKPTQDFENDLPGFMCIWKILNGSCPVDVEMAAAYTKDYYVRSNYPVGVAWNHIRCLENLGDITNKLKEMSIPSLFIAGEKDVMMPPEVVAANAELVRGAKFVIIPKMGHMVFDKDLEIKVADTILEHIK